MKELATEMGIGVAAGFTIVAVVFLAVATQGQIFSGLNGMFGGGGGRQRDFQQGEI